uniref:pyridoxal kinase n=1 Tax=Angomonas desouzai TaxID=59800 RepID=T1YT74_9TRYP|nr:pyridoxal kinase [Angomonas desouzai]
MSEEGKIVLSIQSHVTHGYVGNKAATFPLQLHGFDVDAVNTVSLSNHSGYPVIKGHRMDLQEFQTIVEGLEANHFLPLYRYVLSGYINNPDVVHHLEAVVRKIKELRSGEEVYFLCDPVLGDDGRMYCKEEVIEAYRSILGVADICTPNYYEAFLLSGTEVKDLPTAIEAAGWFHERGTKAVVIKSFPDHDDPKRLRFLLSEKKGDEVKRYTGTVPYHEGRYTGTGDVFAASLLAFFHQYEGDAKRACAAAMGVVQDLIVNTIERGGTGAADLNARELRVTSLPQALLSPSHAVTIEELA